jgi:hypothetical protein
MHFIESLFGLSPDGDSGILELLIVLAPIALAAVVYWRRARNGQGRQHRD